MANFEAFRRVISSNINLLFLKSDAPADPCLEPCRNSKTNSEAFTQVPIKVEKQ